ncbi:hypothetical protein LCGC14_0351740 [marine sediment metagenome]|uniref:YopX protein domain-containing protein n=1 Tax=marine sediment metagenome TaxID=412755 RepID=A0A0F9TAU2_9ZZZZ
MRTIKFRGRFVKAKNALYPEENKWVYGSLVIDRDNSYWIKTDKSSYCVNPETVGEFTGLKDKNRKEIYEGDVVNFAQKKTFCKGEKCHESLELGTSKYCPKCGKPTTREDYTRIAEIVFKQGSFCFHYEISNWATYVAEMYIEWIEIIGNIHENPELLEAEAEEKA